MRQFFVLASILVIAAPGWAQDGDRRDYGRPIDTPENRADMALRFAARCVIDRVPASARKILTSEIGSDDEARRVKGLTGVARECFQPQWPAFPATALRDAIAEVAYRKLHRSTPVTVPTAPPATFAVVASGTKGTPQQEASWQLASIAGCVVFAGPREAHQLVNGPRNVAEEQRRFDAIQPAIRRCVASDTAAALTARNFRGPIAAALFARDFASDRRVDTK